MSDAKLWINDADSTATITGVNVSYTMPLWVFDVMRDIIGAEAEKKVEVTHRDFDIQQELLDRYKAENVELREFAKRMANALGIDSEWCDTSWCDTDCMVEFGCQPAYCGGENRCPAWARLKELGIEVPR